MSKTVSFTVIDIVSELLTKVISSVTPCFTIKGITEVIVLILSLVSISFNSPYCFPIARLDVISLDRIISKVLLLKLPYVSVTSPRVNVAVKPLKSILVLKLTTTN